MSHSLLHPLEQIVYKSLREQMALSQGSRLLVAVSGGADSISLLHILHRLRVRLKLHLMAAYVNHGLRPDETPAEQKYVQTTADSLGILSVVVNVDVRAWAQEQKLSLEHAARELRYQALETLRLEHELDFLAVAHTEDDQIEEVLLRLFRGGGRKALSGMACQAGTVIRPLLMVPKDVLLQYLADNTIRYCHDSSNDDPRFLRNRIRHHLLPLLRAQYDPGIGKALLKTAANLREDEALLEDLLTPEWSRIVHFSSRTTAPPEAQVDRARLRQLHPALQRRLVEKVLWQLDTTARYTHILDILEAVRKQKSGGELHLSQGLRVRINKTHLLFSYPQGKGPWRGRLRSSREESKLDKSVE